MRYATLYIFFDTELHLVQIITNRVVGALKSNNVVRTASAFTIGHLLQTKRKKH